MYLSKLEVFGFKSFAQKVTFQFNDGITAIIGPNGCGKSNIVDSIRWVLGEQRTSLLRLDKMENLIFNGTALRKPLNMVEVSLLIENTKNILPSVYSEVKITRRYYRSGESEFLLNNRLVRLKDVIDLFADTGMGSDAYSVIELKMVEQILSENAEERRRLFEEAAGIKKYKFRRKAALRKLETTEQELQRLSDIIAEVQKTVNSLSRQVGKARRYHQYKDELRRQELYIYQVRKKNFEDDLLPLREEYQQVRQTRERLGKEVTQDEAELEKLQVKAVDLENQFRQISAHLNDLDVQVRDIQQRVQLNEQKIESSRENISEREKEISKLKQRLEENRQQLMTVTQEKEAISFTLAEVEKEFQQQQQAQQQAEQKLSSTRQGFQEFRDLNLLELRQLGQEKENYQRITIEKQNVLQNLEKLKTSQVQLENESKNRQNRLQQLTQEVQDARQKVENYQQKFQLLKQEISQLEDEIAKLENQKSELIGQLARTQSRAQFLKGLIENYEGFSDGIQYIMAHRHQYRGIVDTLVNLVDTEEHYRPVLESYLEAIANYLVVEEVDVAQEIIEAIGQQKKGRLTLLPLSSIPSRRESPSTINIFNGRAVFLKDVIRFDSRFEKIFQLLFDRVAIVSDLQTALELQQKWPDYCFVTQKGEIVGHWGEITGGSTLQVLNLTGRRAELTKVQDEVEQWRLALQENEEQLARQQQVLQQKKTAIEELEKIQRDFLKDYSSLEQQYHQEKFEVNHLAERLAEIRNEIQQIDHRLAELAQQEDLLQPVILSASSKEQHLQVEGERRSRELEEVEKQFSQIFQQTQKIQEKYFQHQSHFKAIQQRLEFIQQAEQEISGRIEQAQLEISHFQKIIETIQHENSILQADLDGRYKQRDEIEKQKTEIENNYQSLKSLILSREEEIKKLHRRWNLSLERLKELELKIQEIEIKLNTQQEQYAAQYGEELNKLLQENPVPENITLAEMQAEIQKLRESIEALGEVNPLAVKEFDKEKERLDFLKTQQSDLLKAKTELLETISKLNKTARQLFMETFEKINNNFKSVFGKFFEGGEAELQLIENSDPLEANIDIIVHIKGKRLTTLSLLSAGEKTLTAISLLFAIYLYKPSPFCILDEVDAPLDDVNIARYTHALKEFSKQTQFILVTHNKMTMQAAQAMYGITMEEPGVSKVVSVRFD